MANSRQAFFLADGRTPAGQRLCLFHPAQGDALQGCVVYVHPFAEEMNKTRRMAALQAQALSEAGFAILQIDLLGCGDSSGDFSAASWQDWVDDVLLACHWLRSHRSPHSAQVPLWLWGLRAGCLLAVDAARAWNGPCNLLFWQPPASGKQVLQQFLRLKIAAEVLEGQAKGGMEALRQQLASGASVDIAGYGLASALAAGLERADLLPAPGQHQVQRLEWLEVSTRQDAVLGPAANKLLAQWQDAGVAAHGQVVSGPPFWQTTEIEEAPALLALTTQAIAGAGASQATIDSGASQAQGPA